MTPLPTSTPRGRRLLAFVALPLALALALAAGTAADQSPALALVNETPSLPLGVYWRAVGKTPAVGAIVSLPQPRTARPYLEALGVSPDVLMIKRVAAVGGQTVCVGDGALETPIGRYRVLERDGRGQALPVWRGCRPLAAEELFLVGDTDTSFDSRYFGPVPRRDILGVYREGVSW